MADRSTFQFRVDAAQRERWRQAARGEKLSESDFARDALDAYVLVCEEARKQGMHPFDLLVLRLQVARPGHGR